MGRYRAGILALFCVMSATVITVMGIHSFMAHTSPITVGLAVTIWGAVMGLNALLVGTLSDERIKKMSELHDAYLGVVEVLSHYLNSADPNLQDRSRRVAEVSDQVARQMKLANKEIDDIRVAALLQELEHIEITAKVIGRAIGDLGCRALHSSDAHTFQGSDLVHSLGSVITGALPLLMTERSSFDLELGPATERSALVPFGARIIQTVRAFDSLMYGEDFLPKMSSAEVVEELRADLEIEHHPAVLHALEQVLFNKPSPAFPGQAIQLTHAHMGI
jgi:response regulator RpfG family c-di-GMP phosphodiesterase